MQNIPKIDQFPSLTPVLIESNYKLNADSGSTVAEHITENEQVKKLELWSAEELTVHLVNKTAMRIASLKKKIDKQLKNIEVLKSNQKYSEKCLDTIDKFNKSYVLSRVISGLSQKETSLIAVVEKDEICQEDNAKRKNSWPAKCNVRRTTASQIVQKQRRSRRGLSFKQFFYHPLVVDCKAFAPEDLTKEQFLRQLRLIPKPY